MDGIGECMDVWLAGWIGWKERWMDEMDGLMNGWIIVIVEWMDELMGWMNVWMEE